MSIYYTYVCGKCLTIIAAREFTIHCTTLSLSVLINPIVLLRYRQEKQKYTILLIITDGMINDLEATKVPVHYCFLYGVH